MKTSTSLPLHIKQRPRKPSGTGGAPAVPENITLTWTSDTSDQTPRFTFDFSDPQVADVVTLRRSTDSGFSTYDDATDTIDSLAPVNELVFDFTPTTWAVGTWYVKTIQTRSAVVIGTSNTESKTLVSAYTPTFHFLGF